MNEIDPCDNCGAPLPNDELRATADYWFNRCVELSLAVTGASPSAYDSAATDADALALTEGKKTWEQIQLQASTQREAGDRMERVRAAVMEWRGHITNKASWERELIAKVQDVLNMKVIF